MCVRFVYASVCMCMTLHAVCALAVWMYVRENVSLCEHAHMCECECLCECVLMYAFEDTSVSMCMYVCALIRGSMPRPDTGFFNKI